MDLFLRDFVERHWLWTALGCGSLLFFSVVLAPVAILLLSVLPLLLPQSTTGLPWRRLRLIQTLPVSRAAVATILWLEWVAIPVSALLVFGAAGHLIGYLVIDTTADEPTRMGVLASTTLRLGAVAACLPLFAGGALWALPASHRRRWRRHPWRSPLRWALLWTAIGTILLVYGTAGWDAAGLTFSDLLAGGLGVALGTLTFVRREQIVNDAWERPPQSDGAPGTPARPDNRPEFAEKLLAAGRSFISSSCRRIALASLLFSVLGLLLGLGIGEDEPNWHIFAIALGAAVVSLSATGLGLAAAPSLRTLRILPITSYRLVARLCAGLAAAWVGGLPAVVLLAVLLRAHYEPVALAVSIYACLFGFALVLAGSLHLENYLSWLAIPAATFAGAFPLGYLFAFLRAPWNWMGFLFLGGILVVFGLVLLHRTVTRSESAYRGGRSFADKQLEEDILEWV
jgi:hypothetical protein